jgi:hypothetical protein
MIAALGGQWTRAKRSALAGWLDENSSLLLDASVAAA